MGRALLILDSPAERAKAIQWIGKAPDGTRVEFKASKRTLPQNDLMWALLTEVAEYQKKHHGRDYATDEWKLIFLHAWGREVRFLPALDGKGAVPIPQSSSDLSKEEMNDFIEFLLAWGAEVGLSFKNHHSDDSPLSRSSDTAGDRPASGGGEMTPSRSLPPLLVRFAKDVLTKAADERVPWSTLKKIEANWSPDIAKLDDDQKQQARKISAAMRAIRDEPSTYAAQVAAIEEMLDAEGQIGGRDAS